MKSIKSIVVTAGIILPAQLFAQFGGDGVSRSLGNVINYARYIGIGILILVVGINFARLGSGDDGGVRAKRNLTLAAFGLGGLLLLKQIVTLIAGFTGERVDFGF